MAVDLDKYRLKLQQVSVLSCRGQVVRLTGMSIESQGPPVGVGQLCEIHLLGGRRVLAEVVGFHGASRVLLPLEGVDGIRPGDPVVPCRQEQHLQLGPDLLGRVVDGLGRPIDDKGALTGTEFRSLSSAAPPPLSRREIDEPLSFGIRVFDGLLTCGRGQRMGIFAGSGVGKSTFLGEMARSSDADVNVVALVGERGREVRAFIEQSLGQRGLERSVVVVATSDASAVQRVKAAFTAATIAEYFRDRGKHVLLMMDSVTRLAMAQREIGLAAGEPPTTRGYCPSVFGLLPKLTERMGCWEHGSITGILTILVESDDMNDPIADSVRSLLDGHVVLSRKLAELGHYPAVDILQSVSRLMNQIAGPDHRLAAQRLRAICATYQGAQDLINIGALVSGANRRIDTAISLIDRVNDFLIQPTGTKTAMDQTLRQLAEITQPWDFLAAGKPAEARV